MPTPTYGGVAIFGGAIQMQTVDNPRSAQDNHFFGLSGLESLDGGTVGRVTMVRGYLSGTSPSDLGTSEELFRSYNDGIARTLIDNRGISWANVKLELFQPTGKVRNGGSVLIREYEARFRHLT